LPPPSGWVFRIVIIPRRRVRWLCQSVLGIGGPIPFYIVFVAGW